MKAMLQAIASTDEFWSEQCVRKQVKSPVDFNVCILRQFGLNSILLASRAPNATTSTPLPKTLRDSAGLTFGTLYTQGMTLLFPPDVSGWKWGKAWITQNNMIARIQFADMIFGASAFDDGGRALASFLGKQISNSNPITSYNAVIKFMTIFDADLPADKIYLLVQAFDKAGGVSSLNSPKTAATSLSAVGRLLFGAPEFQLC